MKKTLILIAALSVAIALPACKKADDKAAAPAAGSPAAPATSNPELDEYIKAYDAFVNDYLEAAKAAKSGDTSKLQALAPKAQEFATKTQALAPKLSVDDAKKLQEYSLKQAERLQQAMQ